jgi:solute carrier family 25 phosphate transporter 3
LADKPFLLAVQTIVREEGFRALWAGLGPTYWGYLLEGAIKFGVYEILKPIVRSGLTRIASMSPLLAVVSSQWLAFMFCAVVSGLAASVVLCPMEALRIRMVAEPSFAKNGWIHGGYRILKEEGVTGLAKGMSAMVFKQVPYTVTKNVSFDVLARFFYSRLRSGGASISGTISFAIPLMAAAIASVLSSITSQPGDMVLSLVNAHEGEKKSADFVRNILQSERGIGGFFVGFKTRLLHVGITVTIQLLIYDYVKRLCGVAATGSL